MTSYRANQRLCETNEKALGQRVPEPLHTRVIQLTDLIYEAGHPRPTKAKLIGAILLAAKADADELVDALAAYERADVNEALLDDHNDGDLIELPLRQPGPRPKRPHSDAA